MPSLQGPFATKRSLGKKKNKMINAKQEKMQIV
jgi:hypothetical protein